MVRRYTVRVIHFRIYLCILYLLAESTYKNWYYPNCPPNRWISSSYEWVDPRCHNSYEQTTERNYRGEDTTKWPGTTSKPTNPGTCTNVTISIFGDPRYRMEFNNSVTLTANVKRICTNVNLTNDNMLFWKNTRRAAWSLYNGSSLFSCCVQ